MVVAPSRDNGSGTAMDLHSVLVAPRQPADAPPGREGRKSSEQREPETVHTAIGGEMCATIWRARHCPHGLHAGVRPNLHPNAVCAGACGLRARRAGWSAHVSSSRLMLDAAGTAPVCAVACVSPSISVQLPQAASLHCQVRRWPATLRAFTVPAFPLQAASRSVPRWDRPVRRIWADDAAEAAGGHR
jgi:hypothetical protein